MTRLPKHLGIANRSAEIRGDRPTEEKLNGVNEAIDQTNGYSSPTQEAVHQAFLVHNGLFFVCLRTILYVRASLVLILGRYQQVVVGHAHPMCMCRMAGCSVASFCMFAMSFDCQGMESGHH